MHTSFFFLAIVPLVYSQPPPGFTGICAPGSVCFQGSAGPDGTTAFTFGPSATSFATQPLPTANGVVFVDDASQLLQYNPPLLWQRRNIGSGACYTCAIIGDIPEAVAGTWHEGQRQNPSDDLLTVDFNFTGTEVAVFALLPKFAPTSNFVIDTSVSFLVDGKPTAAPNWTWIAPSPPPYPFDVANVPVRESQEIFNSGTLPSGDHSLKMVASRRTGDGEALFILDYVAYRTDSASTLGIFSDAIITPASTFESTETQTLLASQAGVTDSATNTSPGSSLDPSTPSINTSASGGTSSSGWTIAPFMKPSGTLAFILFLSLLL